MTPDELIELYLARATSDDATAYAELFAEDAVVVDDGHEHRGIDAIRAWRAAVPAVRYDLREVAGGTAETTTAVVEVSGDFPGSPVTLRFEFELDATGAIARLTIAAER